MPQLTFYNPCAAGREILGCGAYHYVEQDTSFLSFQARRLLLYKKYCLH